MITKRGFMKWLLSTSCAVPSLLSTSPLIGASSLAEVLTEPMQSATYITSVGVKRFTVRMMGGGGGGGSVGQNLTGGHGGVQ